MDYLSSSLLTIIPNSAVQSSSQTLIQDAVLFVNTSTVQKDNVVKTLIWIRPNSTKGNFFAAGNSSPYPYKHTGTNIAIFFLLGKYSIQIYTHVKNIHVYHSHAIKMWPTNQWILGDPVDDCSLKFYFTANDKSGLL